MNLVRSIYLIILLVSVIIGCQESDVTENISLYKRVRIFDDTLANPGAAFNKITIGNNRMMMAYSHSSVNDLSLPGIHYLITDIDGNFIKKDSIGRGMTFYNLFTAHDGDFVLVASPPNARMVYLIHVDKNGNSNGIDSIAMPPENNFNNVESSLQGNMILFTYGDLDGGYILECDFNGNILWSKQLTQPLYNGTPSIDNGYLFVLNGAIDSGFQLLKTNATGESLWLKTIYTPFSPVSSCVSQDNRGNYRICINDYSTYGENPNAPNAMRVYEFNLSGDSVNMIKVNKKIVNYGGAVIQKDEEHTFVLLTVFENYFGFGRPTISARQNTHYVLLDNDLKITEQGELQNQSNDLFKSVAKTPGGGLACFGLVQSYDNTYYKPALFLIN